METSLLDMFKLSDLPKDLRAILSYAVLLPFWMVAIYLFDPWLYSTGDFVIMISICISLTTGISFIVALFLCLQSEERKVYILDGEVTVANICFQVLFLSFNMLWWFFAYRELSFSTFIITHLGIIIGVLAILGTLAYIGRKAKQKGERQ